MKSVRILNIFKPKKLKEYIYTKIRKISPCRYIQLSKLRRFNAQTGKNLHINGKIQLHSYGKINKGDFIIGDNVTLNSNYKKYNPIGYTNPVLFRFKYGGKIKIGNSVGISNASIISYKEDVIIDDYVMLGGGVKIYNTDFHAIDFENRVFHPDDDIACKTVHIKEGAFIGAGSTILKGVTIGEKAVIGANSLVTKSVPDGEIWAGNPAKFVKHILK